VSYLLDTNIISEVARTKPNAAVVEWLDKVPQSALHMSVLSLGEIRNGVERLKPGPRRESLRVWLEQVLTAWLEDRILPVDHAVADQWGRLTAATKNTLSTADSLIAATALTHNLRVVTRNTKDFDVPGLELVNPWKA
jgi:hypothetical protein